jgi:hypothetical protein
VHQGRKTWAIKGTSPHIVILFMLHLMGRAPHIYWIAGRWAHRGWQNVEKKKIFCTCCQ